MSLGLDFLIFGQVTESWGSEGPFQSCPGGSDFPLGFSCVQDKAELTLLPLRLSEGERMHSTSLRLTGEDSSKWGWEQSPQGNRRWSEPTSPVTPCRPSLPAVLGLDICLLSGLKWAWGSTDKAMGR